MYKVSPPATNICIKLQNNGQCDNSTQGDGVVESKQMPWPRKRPQVTPGVAGPSLLIYHTQQEKGLERCPPLVSPARSIIKKHVFSAFTVYKTFPKIVIHLTNVY